MAITDDLKAVYKLNESSGSTAKDSHGSNDGTYNGNLPTAVSGVNQDSGDAQDFDGSNDYVDTPISDSMLQSAYSVSVWFNTDGFSSNGTFVGTYDGNNGALMRLESGDDLDHYHDSSSQEGGSVSTNTWHHVVFVYDGSNSTIYLNGSSVASGSIPNVSSVNNLRLGDSYDGRKLDGRMQHVYIWERAISSSEVSDIYNNGNGFFYPFSTESPDKPTNPSPSDNSFHISTSPTLSVDVTHPNGRDMDVKFFDGQNNQIGSTQTGISSGNSASVTWSGLSNATEKTWYAKAIETINQKTTQSDKFNFYTQSTQPFIIPDSEFPKDNSQEASIIQELQLKPISSNQSDIKVTFKDNSDDSVIGTDKVSDGETAKTIWKDLSRDTQYKWYADLDDN